MQTVDLQHQSGGGYDPPANPGGKDWFLRFFKGVLVGIGAILPGLSGGVLAVIFRLYTPIMRFLGKITYRFSDNLRYFLPVALGLAGGVFIFAFFVSAALGSYASFFTCLFVGLVIGTFPSLYREAGAKGRQTRNFVYLAIAACLIFALMLVGERRLTQVEPNLPVWFLVGAIVGLGVIVPGLSPSNFLIYFGLYKPMSDAIKSLDWPAVIPIGIGGLVSVLLLTKPVNYLLDKHYAAIYHTILGLVIGSSLAILPTVIIPGLSSAKLAELGLSLPLALLICLGFLLVGVLASTAFNRLSPDEAEASQK
ncbi:MAG: DUF368 domain-containing protein [Eubacteriales bacterium]|nr:DUF368 domain-containing protein [Eubacteriales bacterium]